MGHRVFNAKVGELLRVWSDSKNLTYQIYALNFTVPRGDSYSITVTGGLTAKLPRFAVGTPAGLYPGLLLNTLFFYETQRDGPNFIRNAHRDRGVEGHVSDLASMQAVTRVNAEQASKNAMRKQTRHHFGEGCHHGGGERGKHPVVPPG